MCLVYLQVLLLAIVLLVAAVHNVNSLSSGAPLMACNTLTPQHNNPPQTTPSPHVVDLSDFNMTMNDDTGDVSIYYYPDTMYESELQRFMQLVAIVIASIIFSHS